MVLAGLFVIILHWNIHSIFGRLLQLGLLSQAQLSYNVTSPLTVVAFDIKLTLHITQQTQW